MTTLASAYAEGYAAAEACQDRGWTRVQERGCPYGKLTVQAHEWRKGFVDYRSSRPEPDYDGEEIERRYVRMLPLWLEAMLKRKNR